MCLPGSVPSKGAQLYRSIWKPHSTAGSEGGLGCCVAMSTAMSKELRKSRGLCSRPRCFYRKLALGSDLSDGGGALAEWADSGTLPTPGSPILPSKWYP